MRGPVSVQPAPAARQVLDAGYLERFYTRPPPSGGPSWHELYLECAGNALLIPFQTRAAPIRALAGQTALFYSARRLLKMARLLQMARFSVSMHRQGACGPVGLRSKERSACWACLQSMPACRDRAHAHAARCVAAPGMHPPGGVGAERPRERLPSLEYALCKLPWCRVTQTGVWTETQAALGSPMYPIHYPYIWRRRRRGPWRTRA